MARKLALYLASALILGMLAIQASAAESSLNKDVSMDSSRKKLKDLSHLQTALLSHKADLEAPLAADPKPPTISANTVAKGTTFTVDTKARTYGPLTLEQTLRMMAARGMRRAGKYGAERRPADAKTAAAAAAAQEPANIQSPPPKEVGERLLERINMLKSDDRFNAASAMEIDTSAIKARTVTAGDAVKPQAAAAAKPDNMHPGVVMTAEERAAAYKEAFEQLQRRWEAHLANLESAKKDVAAEEAKAKEELPKPVFAESPAPQPAKTATTMTIGESPAPQQAKPKMVVAESPAPEPAVKHIPKPVESAAEQLPKPVTDEELKEAVKDAVQEAVKQEVVHAAEALAKAAEAKEAAAEAADPMKKPLTEEEKHEAVVAELEAMLEVELARQKQRRAEEEAEAEAAKKAKTAAASSKKDSKKEAAAKKVVKTPTKKSSPSNNKAGWVSRMRGSTSATAQKKVAASATTSAKPAKTTVSAASKVGAASGPTNPPPGEAIDEEQRRAEWMAAFEKHQRRWNAHLAALQAEKDGVAKKQQQPAGSKAAAAGSSLFAWLLISTMWLSVAAAAVSAVVFAVLPRGSSAVTEKMVSRTLRAARRTWHMLRAQLDAAHSNLPSREDGLSAGNGFNLGAAISNGHLSSAVRRMTAQGAADAQSLPYAGSGAFRQRA